MADFTSDFHDFDGAIYVNCAFHGAMPRVATDAVEHALSLKKTPHLIRDEYHFTFPDAYRAAVAELIGAAEHDIAVTNSATQGTMILVSGLDWQPGDEVVIPAAEFPSNRFPWRSLEARGVTVREVEISSAEQAIATLSEVVNKRTRVVSVSWVNYSNGLKLDLRALGERCREFDVLFAVDASQAVGGLRFCIDDANIDLLTCAGYKWMLGPYGVGFAWLRPGLAEHLRVSNINWFSLAGARDFNRLSECDLIFEPGARRFDQNEPGNFFNMAGASGAARYLLDVGLREVERHIQGLQDRLIAGLGSGTRSLAPTDRGKRSNILCIALDPPERLELAFERLLEHRIYVSRREGALRVSPHLYNTDAHIDRLLEVLDGAGGAGTGPSLLPRGGRLHDPTPTDPPTGGPFEGRFVRLRPIQADADAQALYPGSHRKDTAALWAYMPYGPFESPDSMRDWLATSAESSDPLFMTVESVASSQAVGVASFLRIKPAARTLEVGHIWYLPEAQRTEANTEAIFLMLSEAFDRRRYRRVEWKCDALNAPSRRAAVRLGFRFEGLFRQHLIVKHRNRDTAWYAMLDGDWPRVKASLEHWLSSDPDHRPSLTELTSRPTA